MDDLADFVNTNKEQAGAAGEAAQDGKVPEQKEPETKVTRGWTLQHKIITGIVSGREAGQGQLRGEDQDWGRLC